MNVVLDTNVVISAILKDRAPEDVILFIVTTPEFDWVATADIVEEYREVLARPKFALPDPVLQRWFEVFDEFITVVESTSDIDFPPDESDAKFLECALSVSADYLVTGDKELHKAKKLVHTTILSVSQFKAIVCDKW